MIRTAIQDFRFALRGWLKAPGFAASIIVTLALGIGANTAIFSVVSGVLLRPLPFSNPERLVQVYETQPRDARQGGFDGPVVARDLTEWRARSRLFEGLISFSTSSRNFQGAGEPEQVAATAAERGLFELLGVAALAGRTFAAGDPANSVVVSHAFWERSLGGDRSAIGRSLTLDGRQFTLLGVMPRGFQFPYGAASDGVWVPSAGPAEFVDRPNIRLDSVVARLKPGVTLAAARQELAAMDGPSRDGRVVRIRALADVVGGAARKSLLMLLGAAGMVLLVACLNVANLLLARTAARTSEIAIRSALGAGPFRLVRQFLAESLMLAIGGGVAGLALGWWGRRILVQLAAAQIPRADEIGLDWRVFAFSLAVTVAAGAGFGLAPALAAARGGAVAIRNRGPRPALRDALVVAEVALAFVLLSGAGLLLRTFLNLRNTHPGVNADEVLTVHVVVSGARESAAIEQRVAQVPGVGAAGLISLLPLQNSGWSAFLSIPGGGELLPVELRYVTPGYFRAMGIPLRRGREFSSRDDGNSARAILVNEALARQYFGAEDPVGRATDRGTVIGVVGDVRQETLGVPARPEVYYTVAQNFGQLRRHGSTLVVKGNAPAAAIRAAVREVSPGQALFRMATMRQVIDESLANPRLYAWLVGLFAALGAVLAITGVYGVIAYLVAVRTREFGVRLALGAGSGHVLRLVMGRGALLVALGLALGMGGAAALTRVLQGVLYGVAPGDPATFGTMAAVVAAAGVGACLAPARRAALVDPAVALRAE